MPVAEGDVEKTAFTTPWSLFETPVLPMGLKNAPPAFQRMMTNVFDQFLGRCCLVYIDDLIIFSKSWGDHVRDVKNVLKRLQEAGLKAKISKCYFGMEELVYLGHRVSGKGIEVDTEKVAAVQRMKAPVNAKQVKSFLGMAGFYRQFIEKFAQRASPLSDLLQKDVVFQWGEINNRKHLMI